MLSFQYKPITKEATILLLSRLPQIAKESWNTAESYWLHCICGYSLFAVAHCSKWRSPVYSYLLTEFRLDRIRISITGLFRGWIFHTLIITSMTVCRKQRCSMAMWGRDAVSKWGCDSPCWHLRLVLNPPVSLGFGNSECSGIWGSAFLGGKQLCFG